MGVGDGAVAMVDQRAVGRTCHDGDAGGIQPIVGIRVVGDEVDHDIAALVDAAAVVRRDRRVVLRSDGDADVGGVGNRAGQVFDGVGEAVGGRFTAVVGVGDGAVAVVDQRPVGRAGDDGDTGEVESIVGIAVVGREAEHDAAAFGDGAAVVVGHRRVVLRVDGQANGGGVGKRAAQVLYRICEAVSGRLGAVVSVGDRAVAVVDQRAVGRAGDNRDAGQVEAVVGIAVVGREVDDDAAALVDAATVVRRNRRHIPTGKINPHIIQHHVGIAGIAQFRVTITGSILESKGCLCACGDECEAFRLPVGHRGAL